MRVVILIYCTELFTVFSGVCSRPWHFCGFGARFLPFCNCKHDVRVGTYEGDS